MVTMNLMYFKIQSDQPRTTQNSLESQIFDLFTNSSSEHFAYSRLITLNFKIHQDEHFRTSRSARSIKLVFLFYFW